VIKRIAGITAILTTVLIISASSGLRAAATVVIINGNVPGVGFNDLTAAAPVGGNSGTTLGQQRLIAFQKAADIWGQTLDSPVPIRVLATFTPLTCNATSAVLGSAGALTIFTDFGKTGLYPGPLLPATWHGGALADRRAGFHVVDPVEGDAPAEIRARFNSNLGNVGCLTGIPLYLGLDNNHGGAIDLVTVLLHEFAHGLGFQQFADVATGEQLEDKNDVYNVRIFDNSANKYWYQMTNAERAASAVNARNVVFDGPEVNAAVPTVLSGTPMLNVTAPAAIARIYQVGTAGFGAPLTSAGIMGSIVLALDASDAAGLSTTDACSPIANAAAVAGQIALVDRGTCGFVVKVKNAQIAGAVAVVVADNAPGPVAGMGGADPTIVIPSVRITLADGNTIKAQLGSAIVDATVGLNTAVLAGTDSRHLALLYTPTALAPGSTISHWDVSAFRNQLMEPAINGDLTHSVKPPQDLTLPLLRDIGWFQDADLDGLADNLDSCPASDRRATVVVGAEDTGVANPMFTTGCTIADLVAAEATGARNHGAYVSGVAHLTDALRDAGRISGSDKGRIQSAAAHTK
jgi:hypothetical protein